VEFEWNEAKNTSNRQKHGVDFTLVRTFDWAASKVMEDRRRDYGEARFISYGYAEDGAAYVIVFTVRFGIHRIISARHFGRKDHQFYDTL
jgi:uncharacterized protein